MTRPLRIEFPGAVYHVTARGNRREAIFEGDDDRALLLKVVGQTLERFDAQMLAYCFMGNHYHLVLYTRQANLSALMQQLNGIYSQAYNRRHHKAGHLFQGRFKAILVDRESYLLEVCRYVELNPVRAAMVEQPGEWPWSSYRAHVGLRVAPEWLDTPGLHACLLGREAATAALRRRAASLYVEFVAAGLGQQLWSDGLRQQIYLGDDDFVRRTLDALEESGLREKATAGIPKDQTSCVRTLAEWTEAAESRGEALWLAHTRSGITMTSLAGQIGLTVGRVSQLIRSYEDLKIKA